MTRLSAILIAAAVLGGCTSNGGYTQTRADANGYADARSACWETAMNIGGLAQTVAQMSAYDACMARNGWEDRRRVF